MDLRVYTTGCDARKGKVLSHKSMPRYVLFPSIRTFKLTARRKPQRLACVLQ